MELEVAMQGRRTVRKYKGGPLRGDYVHQLMWAASGVTSPKGRKTAPSAGAIYPIEVYGTTDAEKIKLIAASAHQKWIEDAGVVFVLAAHYEKNFPRYGEERGMRYTHIEAGHIAQNILLQAEALGLGAACVGAFVSRRVASIMQTREKERPVYLVIVGEKG